MILNRLALKRQVTVLALLVIIVIAGLYSYATLPRESFPDITIPYVFVTTTYEGVSPEDMEELITIPIERKLKGIDDVEEIRSTSAEGISTVAIKFMPEVDINDALQKVRDKIDQAEGDLPAELQDLTASGDDRLHVLPGVHGVVRRQDLREEAGIIQRVRRSDEQASGLACSAAGDEEQAEQRGDPAAQRQYSPALGTKSCWPVVSRPNSAIIACASAPVSQSTNTAAPSLSDTAPSSTEYGFRRRGSPRWTSTMSRRSRA